GPDVTAGGPVEARQHPYALQCERVGRGGSGMEPPSSCPRWGPCPPGGGEPGVAPGAADRRGGRGQVQERQRHHRDLPDAAALSQGGPPRVCGPSPTGAAACWRLGTRCHLQSSTSSTSWTSRQRSTTSRMKTPSTSGRRTGEARHPPRGPAPAPPLTWGAPHPPRGPSPALIPCCSASAYRSGSG
uniref:Plexin B2 n=1 Tax=Pan paniscus TaxID=9597 RepID=A0A2R9CCL6_PANPA